MSRWTELYFEKEVSCSKSVWHASYAENSRDPTHKCIIGEKGQNGDQIFTSVTWGLDWDSWKNSLDFKVKLLDYLQVGTMLSSYLMESIALSPYRLNVMG